MNIIASYPRSGSTYLKFILCNLLRPEQTHTFSSVNSLIPAIESDEMLLSNHELGFYKTHHKRPFARFHLLRHVGDVLISEYYYQKKFHNIEKSLCEWIIDNDYGGNWREFVNYYYGCNTILYKDLYENPVETVSKLFARCGRIFNEIEIEIAVEKSTKENIRAIEGEAAFPNPDLFFVRDGSIGQFESLPVDILNRILEKNKKELMLC